MGDCEGTSRWCQCGRDRLMVAERQEGERSMHDPAHILIADDIAELREVLRFHLEHAGFAVREAGTGREAIEEVERDCPALLLLDVTMPDMDGWAGPGPPSPPGAPPPTGGHAHGPCR